MPIRRVRWQRYCRLISSAYSPYSPIDVFDDIADPSDWPRLIAGESLTNPRLHDSLGQLDLVAQEHRVGGPGASYVMAPFVHVSPERPGRFHDGHTGAFYAANRFDTAVLETAYHRGLFFAATHEPPGWLTTLKELVGAIDARLADIRGAGYDELLNPDDYTASQLFANQLRAENKFGIVYPSVRDPNGQCFAALHPKVISFPVQGRHLEYHWDGERIDLVREHTAQRAVYRIEA